jgi:hypothetical protein
VSLIIFKVIPQWLTSLKLFKNFVSFILNGRPPMKCVPLGTPRGQEFIV